ncbi:hypothetical protein [Wandonia haliotis]|uniref:hypothetical protein n=1 Tax=Wandonia haliotis TaxID=574963 RepID=UPI0031D4183C
MRKTYLLLLVGGILVTFGISSCKKECGDCPDSHFLVVDNPKEGDCICCPNGTTYEGGFCQE